MRVNFSWTYLELWFSLLFSEPDQYFRTKSVFHQKFFKHFSMISKPQRISRVSKLCSWKHVYWRSFINASSLKFLYSRYCIIFSLCLLQKTQRKWVKVISWKSDDPVSITIEIWNYFDLFVMISSVQVDPFPRCRST